MKGMTEKGMNFCLGPEFLGSGYHAILVSHVRSEPYIFQFSPENCSFPSIRSIEREEEGLVFFEINACKLVHFVGIISNLRRAISPSNRIKQLLFDSIQLPFSKWQNGLLYTIKVV